MKNIKILYKKIILCALTVLISCSGIVGNIRVVKASEEAKDVQEEVMSDDEINAFLKQYLKDHEAELKGDENDEMLPVILIGVLKTIAVSALSRCADEGVTKVMEVFFGPNTDKQMLKAVDDMEKKVDEITRLLSSIIEKMNSDDIKKSILEKQKDIKAIASMITHADQLFEDAYLDGRDYNEVKAYRWDALQKWYSFSLNGSGNSITSFQYLCDRLVNKNNNFSKYGNYVEHYELYAKTAFHWDVQMVSFSDSQQNRDLYYVAQMAALNLVMIEYAEQNKYPMNYDAQRQIIKDGLEQVIKAYTETEKVKLEHTNDIKYMRGDKVLIISEDYREITSEAIKEHIDNDIYEGHLIWETEKQFKSDIEDRVGYHMMTNEERDVLVNTADYYKISLDDDMVNNGGFKESITPYLTSACEGYKRYYHYGDSHSGVRNIYFENFNTKDVGKAGYRNTIIASTRTKNRNNEDFDKAPFNFRSKINNCFYLSNDEDTYKMMNLRYKYYYVRNNSKGVSTVGYEEV